jgi:hypothetical protein
VELWGREAGSCETEDVIAPKKVVGGEGKCKDSSALGAREEALTKKPPRLLERGAASTNRFATYPPLPTHPPTTPMASRYAFSAGLKELRFLFCQTSEPSAAVR